jgi:hypothetical protein
MNRFQRIFATYGFQRVNRRGGPPCVTSSRATANLRTVERTRYSGRFSQWPRTPMMPLRNSITEMTKMAPWITVTQAPRWAR